MRHGNVSQVISKAIGHDKTSNIASILVRQSSSYCLSLRTLSRRGQNESRGKNKEERMTAKGDSLDVWTIFMHRQLVSMGSTLRNNETFLLSWTHVHREKSRNARSTDPRNQGILYRISRDGVLRKHWNRITKDTRLQESDSVLSDEAAVPRFDTLTMKVEKSTLI